MTDAMTEQLNTLSARLKADMASGELGIQWTWDNDNLFATRDDASTDAPSPDVELFAVVKPDMLELHRDIIEALLGMVDWRTKREELHVDVLQHTFGVINSLIDHGSFDIDVEPLLCELQEIVNDTGIGIIKLVSEANPDIRLAAPYSGGSDTTEEPASS